MAVSNVPARLPTLEPVKQALGAALTADLGAALAQVAARFPNPAITLPLPRETRLATVRRWDQVRLWPTLLVIGSDVRIEQAGQVPGAGQWLGDIELAVFLQDQDHDQLALALDRYLAALWLVVINNEPFARAAVDGESVAMEASEPGGNTPHMRAAALTFSVRFRT